MAKKIWYSTPLKMFWNEVYPTQKKITPELSDEEIFKALVYQNAKAPIIPPETEFERENFRIGLDLWWEDYNKNFLHIFFIDKQLEDLLSSKILLKDISGIKQYLFDNGEKKAIVYKTTKQVINCISYGYGIHIPYETEGYAFQLNVWENNTFEVCFFHKGICGRLTETMFNELKNKYDKESIMFKKYFRLAINTLAYMKVFPDCVVDGVPKITIDRNEKRTDNNITLKISEKIVSKTETGRTVTPHHRNWYIKYLRSDFYTKKRGQLVLVRETMVNGRAKTYYTASDLEKCVDAEGS